LSVYSSRLFAGEGGGSLTDLFTAPASTVTVLRDIQALNLGSGTDSLDLIAVVSGPTSLAFLRFSNIGASESIQWSGRLVLDPGDVLQAFSGVHDWTLLLSGYLLTS
jgi:hypothetical protein